MESGSAEATPRRIFGFTRCTFLDDLGHDIRVEKTPQGQRKDRFLGLALEVLYLGKNGCIQTEYVHVWWWLWRAWCVVVLVVVVGRLAVAVVDGDVVVVAVVVASVVVVAAVAAGCGV